MRIHIAGIIVLCILITSLTALGGSFISLQQQTEQKGAFSDNLKVVRINTSQQKILGKLIDHNIPIIEYNKSQNYSLILISPSDLTWIKNENFTFKILYNTIGEMKGWDINPEILRDFTSYAELTTQLQEIVDLDPHIAELYDLGQSVQGRTIWGLKITDNPDIEENEPEVRICGLHHGDELMSAEIPLLLAWYLVENYSNNSYIADLIDNREIWIIPMVNPDGREATPYATRYNANGIDLNRDYGYMWGVYSNCFTQPETQTIRNHALDNNFVLSLSFHTYGDIVNYIWNYKGDPVADNAIVVNLSSQYGSHNGYWVVEGYDWYQTRGDTNDFSYGCRGDIDWTIEIQDYDILEAWNFNRDASIEIIEASNKGLTGVVTDELTGEPLAATIWVEEAFWPCFTDSKIGDYHRILLPGNYTVRYQANGYISEIYSIEVNDSDEPTILNVDLNTGDTYYAYQVTHCNFYDPYGYPNNFQNNPTEAISALGPPDGVCASLGRGGVLVVDMKDVIINREDMVDFKIFEGDNSSDGYHVRVSQEWNGPWISVGYGFGTTEFDLEDGSIDWARFIEIRDDYDGNPYEQNPGVDIDAIQNYVRVNSPPNTPNRPEGPSQGEPNVEYIFSTVSTDIDNDQIFYNFSWGDGTFSGWMGPYNSNETGFAPHSWSENGSYEIKAIVKDVFNEESDWSYPLNVTIELQSPYVPTNPFPENSSTDVDIDILLNWTGGDPNPYDTVSYDVYFGISAQPPKVVSNQSNTSYDLGPINESTLYFWKIVAWDNNGNSASSPIWSFITMGIPPEITTVTMITSDPLDTDIGWENFSCTVTDNTAVDKVKLVLTGDTTTEYTMTKNGDDYYCNTTISTADRYTYHIWANDTSRNYNTSAYQPFNLSMNEDVNMDGSVGFVDIMMVAGMWNVEGPNGWDRADVDNDGEVGFVDVMMVAGMWGQEW